MINKNLLNNFMEFSNKCKINMGNEICNLNPFSEPNEIANFDDIICHRSELLNELVEQHNFPLEFKLLYSKISDNHEIFYKNVIFLSLETIKKKFISYSNYNNGNNGQTRFVDIAIMYHGMGYYYVLSWERNKKKCFIRIDGGSNGYDRSDNFEYFMNLKTENLSDNYLFDFSEIYNANFIDRFENMKNVVVARLD